MDGRWTLQTFVHGCILWNLHCSSLKLSGCRENYLLPSCVYHPIPLLYEDNSKSFRALFFFLNLCVTDIRTLIFNVMAFLFDTHSPPITRLFNATKKKGGGFSLVTKSLMHSFFHLVVICNLKTKRMEIGRGQVWAVGRVLQNFPIQFLSVVDGEVSRMGACLVV